MLTSRSRMPSLFHILTHHTYIHTQGAVPEAHHRSAQLLPAIYAGQVCAAMLYARTHVCRPHAQSAWTYMCVRIAETV